MIITVIPVDGVTPWHDCSEWKEAEAYAAELEKEGIATVIEKTEGDVV